MTDAQLIDRLQQQIPTDLPLADWDDVVRRAAQFDRDEQPRYLGPWRRRRQAALIVGLIVGALLILTASAVAYQYFTQPVSPQIRLYLQKLTNGGHGIRFDPARARVQVQAANTPGAVLLWTAPSRQFDGSLVWGFQVQPSPGSSRHIRDLGANCCGNDIGQLQDWGGQALSHEVWLEAGYAAPDVTRVAVTFENQTTQDAALSNHHFVARIGPTHYQPRHHPVALVAYSSNGHVVATLPLDPTDFRSPTSTPNLHPKAEGRALFSLPLLTNNTGQIWIKQGVGGAYGWTFVVTGHAQLLGAQYAKLSDNPSNHHVLVLTGLRYTANGRRETIIAGDAWQIHSATWITARGRLVHIPLHPTPPKAWPYIGDLVVLQIPGWRQPHGRVLTRNANGRIIQRIQLGDITIQSNT